MGERSRFWCFTVNNPTEADAGTIGTAFDKGELDYIVLGKEVGESGTHHIQGYMICKKKTRLSTVKKLLSTRAHLEAAKGTPQQASDYCKKEGDYREYGELPEPKHIKGGRANAKRYSDAYEQACKGDLEAIDKELLTKHYNTYKRIKLDHIERLPDLEGTCGIWYYGLAGAGKTRTARATYPDAYPKRLNKWWDGYDPLIHKDVIVDDIDKSHTYMAHDLKIWTQEYDFLAETKGASILIRPEHIVITSQYKIDEIWEDQETRDALNRRFKCIHVVKNVNDELKYKK